MARVEVLRRFAASAALNRSIGHFFVAGRPCRNPASSAPIIARWPLVKCRRWRFCRCEPDRIVALVFLETRRYACLDAGSQAVPAVQDLPLVRGDGFAQLRFNVGDERVEFCPLQEREGFGDGVEGNAAIGSDASPSVWTGSAFGGAGAFWGRCFVGLAIQISCCIGYIRTSLIPRQTSVPPLLPYRRLAPSIFLRNVLVDSILQM